ncbi:MAG: hypothetical protein WBO73_03370 [Gammaproteobacteria bacterium]|jgi:hypothetical protein
MDNPTTLLVAIMFVTVLAMAIGNILMVCAEIAGGLRRPMPERIQLSWIFLMLFALLSLFWETTALLEVEQWLFVEFLYVIAGPMVLLFATSVITAPASDQESIESHGHYFELCPRFFIMLALHEVWILGIDYWYATFSTRSLIGAAMLVLYLILAFSGSLRVHVAGASLIWAGYVLGLVLRTLGTTGTQ